METDDIKCRLGAFIRAVRRSQDLSQERLAELAQLHPTYISHIESGRSLPSLDVLIRISKALGGTAWQYLKAVSEDGSSGYQEVAEGIHTGIGTGIPEHQTNEELASQILVLLQECTPNQLSLIKEIAEFVRRTPL